MNIQKFFFVFVIICCASYTSTETCFAEQDNKKEGLIEQIQNASLNLTNAVKIRKIRDKLWNSACDDQDSFKEAIEEANKGNVHLQVDVAMRYGSCGNAEKEIEWFKKGAEVENPVSTYFLGILYEKGRGVEKDGEKSCQLVKKSVELNEKKKEERFEELRKKGDIDRRLANCYLKGLGGEVNYIEAEKSLRKAAKHNLDAKFELALQLMYGKKGRFTHNGQEGLQLLKEASKDGLSSASYVLYWMYSQGKNVQKNEDKARKYLELSEKQHAKNPDKTLKYIKKRFGETIKKETESAAKSQNSSNSTQCGDLDQLQPAVEVANKGDAELQLALGLWYINCKNYQEAAKWFKASTENENAIAMFFLGTFYEVGRGVEKNGEIACQFFKNSVDANKRKEDEFFKFFQYDAGMRLAACHLQGLGVEKNISEAEKILRSLSQHKFENFENKVYQAITLMSDKKNSTRNEKEIVRLLKEASEGGLRPASYILSQMYMYGKGVQKDESEARNYLKLVGKQHEEPSLSYKEAKDAWLSQIREKLEESMKKTTE